MPDCACFFVLDVVSGKSLCSDRITAYLEVIPQKCGSVRMGDHPTGTLKSELFRTHNRHDWQALSRQIPSQRSPWPH